MVFITRNRSFFEDQRMVLQVLDIFLDASIDIVKFEKGDLVKGGSLRRLDAFFDQASDLIRTKGEHATIASGYTREMSA